MEFILGYAKCIRMMKFWNRAVYEAMSRVVFVATVCEKIAGLASCSELICQLLHKPIDPQQLRVNYRIDMMKL
jgi:hypothetical protein